MALQACTRRLIRWSWIVSLSYHGWLITLNIQSLEPVSNNPRRLPSHGRRACTFSRTLGVDNRTFASAVRCYWACRTENLPATPRSARGSQIRRCLLRREVLRRSPSSSWPARTHVPIETQPSPEHRLSAHSWRHLALHQRHSVLSNGFLHECNLENHSTDFPLK